MIDIHRLLDVCARRQVLVVGFTSSDDVVVRMPDQPTNLDHYLAAQLTARSAEAVDTLMAALHRQLMAELQQQGVGDG